MDTKICSKCKIEKYLTDFNKNKRQKDGYQTNCKICQKEYNQNNKEILKQYYQNWFDQTRSLRYKYNKKHRNNNKEKYKEYSKKYRSKLSYKEKRKEYEKQCRQNDVNFRLIQNMRRRINSLLKGQNKKSSQNLLGCSIDEFRLYIENKFVEGMSWDNYGLYGWHIDHIIPISSAKNNEELEKLFHYTNCQPLWAKDNLSKGDKLI